MAVENNFATDKIKTGEGELSITFLGHATLMISFNGKIIHIDPVSQYSDYSKLPKADLILVTHEHSDHCDLEAIGAIRTDKTIIVITEDAAEQVQGGIVMKNGDKKTIQELLIEAVPAYNLVNMRSPGVPYHGKGTGNGYIITCGGKRIYIAGDTENIPEMKVLKDIDIAFLPMNIPYTMTPEMVADAARAFKPGILYPYHYGETDVQKLIDLLKDEKNIEVRIRKMM
ncbi:MAG: MBL fold metallo-hydrolase [Bacteroidales bacterium]|nr:MBL fold metallo-hydrolase [Bacteroidales bacterium]